MEIYKKTFTVDNTLITYEVWNRHQTEGWKERFGIGTPSAIFHVRNGVADAYYQDEIFFTFKQVEEARQKKDPEFFFKAMDQYETEVDAIQQTIALGRPFTDAEALVSFTKQFENAWIGLDISYMPDQIAMDASAERRSAAAREKAFGFYIGADRLIRQTVATLFPDHGAFAKYLSLKEVVSGKLPSRTVLEERSKHYIYFKSKIITGMAFEEFCQQENIRIESVYAPLRDQLRGQVAQGGEVKGTARVFTPDFDRTSLKKGDIIVASDLDSSEISLINQASGIVLDASSYYGSAAIAARAFKKPCIFATRIATMVLQTGDFLEFNGETGTIHVTHA